MTTLFDQAPYQRHSPSSRDGARQVARGGKAASIRATVLAWFNERGRQGGTDEELIHALRDRGDVPATTQDSTIRARRIELTRADLVRNSGDERRTLSGGTAVVWVTTKFGPREGRAV